jgi:signal transduction histidine kinase
MNILRQLTAISATDLDDARRRKLLNILLIGITVSLFFAVTLSTIIVSTRGMQDTGIEQIFLGSGILLTGMFVIYFINKYRSGKVAATLFLILITLVVTFSDSLVEVSTGRSLFIFTIPIIMASVLLAPASSFIFSGLSSLIISFIAISINRTPNIPAIGGYFVVALVSWLSSRSLEQALRELRDINANLDQIVKERTHALAEALTRERIEAGRSQAILESIADGVIVFDTQGSAIQANPALSNLINIPLNNILNTTVNDLVETSPMDAKNKGTLAGVLTRPGRQYASHRVEWGRKTLSISSGQVLDRDGSEVGTVAVFRDFTREAEVEKMKSAFVAMVSHELRTPLSAILGYAEIFMEQIYGPLNEKQANMTNRIVTNTRRLLSLINDLLDQAQMEAGKLTIKYETMKPSDLLENLHSVMDKLTADKNLKLTSELDSKLPVTLKGDSARLQQILVNLVNNAVKFTEEGSIHVQLSRLDEQHWGIKVSDTGLGIPKEELPRIFETFRQVEGTTTRVHGGFGLGLSIVKHLVTLMGGNVSVESELGKGSVFSITLPFETDSVALQEIQDSV